MDARYSARMVSLTDRKPSLALTPSILAAFALVVVVGCVPVEDSRLADCQALLEEQPECMDDEALADCNEANETCQDSGEVAVGESCPLEFTCNEVASG